MPGESSSETENPYGRMHVTEPVRATIPVQNGARLSWDPWILQSGVKFIFLSKKLAWGVKQTILFSNDNVQRSGPSCSVLAHRYVSDVAGGIDAVEIPRPGSSDRARGFIMISPGLRSPGSGSGFEMSSSPG